MKLLSRFFSGFFVVCCLISENPTLRAEEKAPTTKTDEAKPDQPKQKSIAVIPVQKAFPHPLYLSTHPGLITRLKRFFQEKDFKLGEMIDYDPEYVQQTLNELIAQAMFNHDYLVFLPSQVGPVFERLTLFEKEFPLESLTQTFPADAFLLITLTEWDAENFDRSGSVKTGFDAVLIDAHSKRAVWSNHAAGMNFKTPGKDFLYSKYQRDVLHELSGKILKGFPKKNWQDKT